MQRVIRRRYTDDFKAQAVSLAQSIGPSNAARQLDISVKTLANWLDKPARASDSTTAKRTPTSEADSELSRLRAENAMLKMERDILKKATAFFANQST